MIESFTCKQFLKKLLKDGWKITHKKGSIVYLQFGDQTRTLDLRFDTGYLDPNGDGTTLQWVPTPSGTHYSTIDEINGNQTNLNTADYISKDSVTGSFSDEFNMESITGVGSVSQIVIWVYGLVDNALPSEYANVYANIKIDATWQTEQQILVSKADQNVWKSVTFSGLSMTQAQLDALQIRLRADLNYIDAICTASVYAMYAEVTYTAAVTDTGKFFLMF